MAQVSTGFPWSGQNQEPDTILSEKVIDKTQNSTQQPEGRTTEVTFEQPARVPTDKQKNISRSSRKRAASVKASQPYIPQTREELDSHLSYSANRSYNVRTIPAWVRDAEEDDIADELDDILETPHTALVAQHNTNPSNTLRPGRHARTGRKERHVMSSGELRDEKTSRWITFARTSAYPRENFNTEQVDVQWLNENFTDYSRPWLAGQDDDPENEDNKYEAFKRKRKGWYKRTQYVILRNPFVPLAFRFIVVLFAAIAIGLGASIYHESGIIRRCLDQQIGSRTPRCQRILGDQQVDYYQDPSGLMAVIIDAIAIIYTMYITYDEYFSKPLGLRPAKAKIRLVLLDLFFIVFQSANLSLAFESLTVDDGACFVGSEPTTSYRFDKICNRAQSLASVLLISLFAWLLTFSVSVLRLVERINAR